MTIAELERAMQSYKRRKEAEARERASYDYILADLIGRSCARVHSPRNTFPEISAAYPTLFDSAEIAEQKKAKQLELSALRFKHFADAYNTRFKQGGSKS